jgi:hypothetical protein
MSFVVPGHAQRDMQSRVAYLPDRPERDKKIAAASR